MRPNSNVRAGTVSGGKVIASEGTRFADNISQGTWTQVSVPSIFSSLYPTSNGISTAFHRLPSSVTTMPEVFRDAGYATLSTSSVSYTGRQTNLHQGVEVLHESGSIVDLEHSWSKTARTFVDRLVPWLEDHRDAPFFIFLHVQDPHAPFEPYRPYDTAWAAPGSRDVFLERVDTIRASLDDHQWRAAMPYDIEIEAAGVDREAFIAHELDWYDGSIRGMDTEVARLFEKLRELGLDDDTLLVFMSDHGEEFLEHGRHNHGATVYGEMVNVPLFFWWPGVVPAGAVVDEVMQSIDVMPTVLELAGLSVPEQAQGQRLVPLMAAPDAPDLLGWVHRPALSERRVGISAGSDLSNIESLAVVLDGWKLVKNLNVPEGRSEFELYNHSDDPLNLDDVAVDHPDIVQRLAVEIDTWQEWALAQKVEEEPTNSIPPEELARLRATSAREPSHKAANTDASRTRYHPRPLPDRRPPRRGRHGRGLQGHRHPPRPHRRHQGAARACRQWSGSQAAVRARGPDSSVRPDRRHAEPSRSRVADRVDRDRRAAGRPCCARPTHVSHRG